MGSHRDVDLVVVGLGYVGLPLSQAAVLAGLRVLGLDRSTRVTDGLNEGRSHVDDIADADLREMLAAGFRATTDGSVIERAAAVVICVPTPLTDHGAPDLSAVNGAVATIVEHLQPGTLVVLESTTYPGTTDDVVRPALEATGLTVGVDFHLAFSPERIDPGNPTYGLANTPKVVGGCTPQCTKAARGLYERFVSEVVEAKSPREAEMAKLLENTYRHVNIALVNEMAMGIPFRFVELAQEINARMPLHVVQRAADLLNTRAKAVRGSRVLLLGVTYKPDISDQRETPATAIATEFLNRGADLCYYDRNVESWDVAGTPVPRVTDYLAEAERADLTILLQPHRDIDVAELADRAGMLFDTRGKSAGHPRTVLL